MDTVGAKHLSLYGYPRRTTPNIERFAEKCTVYNRCFAPSSWTVPSHGSMFTGLFPSQHGAFEGRFLLNPNVQHLVTALKMQGYQTWGISSNGLVTPGFGLLPDFDFFKDFGGGIPQNFVKDLQARDAGLGELQARLSQGLTVRQVAGIFCRYVLETGRLREAWKCGRILADKWLKKWQQTDPLENSSRYSEDTVTIFRQLLRQPAADQERPFFLFINLMEAHQKFRPPFKFRRFSKWYNKQYLSIFRCYYQSDSAYKNSLLQTYCNLYDDELRYEDDVLGRLWEIAGKSPSADRTVWIVTSDHGEQFGEKEYYGHGFSLYHELIWVPLIIRFPDGLAARGPNNRLVSLVDLYATLLDLAENPLPRPVSSSSLLDATERDLALAQIVYPEIFRNQLDGKLELCRRAGQDFSPHTLAAITAAGLKLISSRDGTLEAYNLERDPGEENNLAKAAPAPVLADWREIINALAAETDYTEAWQSVAAGVPRFSGSEGRQGPAKILQNLFCS
jgi:arylsulfatase A-like enzyme